jgi:dTDP-4-dehydrorhamnose reductase
MQVVATTRGSSGSVTSGHHQPQITAVLCDLTDYLAVEQLFARQGPFEVVINTAALSQPGLCQEDPLAARFAIRCSSFCKC